jgi:hypothetical protein
MVATEAETATADQTTKDKEEKEECSTPEYQKLNKGDTAGVKYALDELLVEVVTGDKQGGYPEDFTTSNVRISLSFLVCLMAPVSHFLPEYLEGKRGEEWYLKLKATLGMAPEKEITTPAVVLTCLVVYALGTIALAVLALAYERDAILFTKPKKTGTFSTSGLRVSTELERYDDMFKVIFAPLQPAAKGKKGTSSSSPAKINKEKQFQRDPMVFEKSITQWIDVNGVVAEDIVKKDMEKFLKQFEKSAYKKKA